jgi:hypothetical protein
MATPEQIDLLETDVARLIQVAHKSLNYWDIMDVFLKAVCDLHFKASVEYQVREAVKA